MLCLLYDVIQCDVHAPVEGGGALFSMEEAACFWNMELVWCVVPGARHWDEV